MRSVCWPTLLYESAVRPHVLGSSHNIFLDLESQSVSIGKNLGISFDRQIGLFFKPILVMPFRPVGKGLAGSVNGYKNIVKHISKYSKAIMYPHISDREGKIRP